MSAAERVTPDDLKSKLRELEGEATSTAQQAKSYAVTAAAVAAVVVLSAAFILGRRRGKKKTTVVEIKRV